MITAVLTKAPRLRIAAFAFAYFAITSLTIGMTRFGGGLALVWLGTAVAATLLISLPRRHWPSALVTIMAASALATSLFGFGPRMAAPLALVNGLETWLVAWLLLFARPARDWFDDVGALALFILLAGIIAPGIAAIPGGIVASFATPDPWYAHAASWWAGHGLGTLIGFPIVFLIGGQSRQAQGERLAATGWVRLALHLSLVLAVSVLAIAESPLPLLFLPIVPLLLAAFRCGREGAVLGTLIVAGVTVWASFERASPVASLALSPGAEVLFLQLYLATISLLAIPVSIALRQHQLILARLEESKALEQLVADHSDDALLNLDEFGRIRYASPAGPRLCGEDELEGRQLSLFFDPIDEPLVRATLARACARPSETQVVERPVLCNDEQLWLQAKIRAVAPADADGHRTGPLKGYAVTIRDVTARKRTELDAIRAAETDTLTGLPNRLALLRVLERALGHANQRPLAVAILDIDHFKAINDRHGHLAGDAALREVGAAMARLASPSVFFARLGGEEFAIVVREGEFAAAQAVCEALRETIGSLALVSPAGDAFRITASLGLARIDRRVTPALALHTADALLYRAKNEGRNRVVSSPAEPAGQRARAA